MGMATNPMRVMRGLCTTALVAGVVVHFDTY